MDITLAAISAQKQLQTQNEVVVSVLKKVIDIQTEQGADMAKLVAQAGGTGQRVDLYA